jgi:importin subunit alpha-1
VRVECACVCAHRVLVAALTACPHESTRVQAVWALANLAGDLVRTRAIALALGRVCVHSDVCVSMCVSVRAQPKYRDVACLTGALPAVLTLWQQHQAAINTGTTPLNLDLLKHAVFLVSNLCRGDPAPPFEWIKPALPFLSVMLQATDEDILSDACWALSYITDDHTTDNSKIESVVSIPSVLTRLVDLLAAPLPLVKKPALRTLGNVVTGNDRQTQAVMNTNILAAIGPLLYSPQATIRREAYWVLSNMCAGTAEQIQAIINANLLPKAVDVLMDEGVFDVQKEALWTIANAASGGTPQQVQYLVEKQAVPAVCRFLHGGDTTTLSVALDALGNILHWYSCTPGMNAHDITQKIEECQGLDALETLQYHESDTVYEKASTVLTTYFEVDEEKEETSLLSGEAQD